MVDALSRAARSRRGSAGLALVLGCLLPLGLPGVSRAELNAERYSVGPELDVTVLHGYPRAPLGFHGPATVGFELYNRGGERSVRVSVQGDSRTERTLRLPARERRRLFLYLPVRLSFYDALGAVTVTDLSTGKRKEVGVEAHVVNEEMLLRLGPLASALNVDKPFTFGGPLDAHMPDDWRGLAGVRMIVMDHAHAVAHPPDWRVLLDWVAMGGVLLIATQPQQLAEAAPWPSKLAFASALEEKPGGFVQQVGLGSIVRLHPEELANVSSDFLARIGACSDCLRDARWFESDPNFARTAARSRLSRLVSRPGWTLFFVLAAFAVVVGPGGWLVLIRRRGRPLKYLVFTLAVSAGFCMAVLSADLLENGLRAKVVPSSMIVIDQRADVEIGMEDAAIYAPAGSGRALRLLETAQPILPTLDIAGAGRTDAPLELSIDDGRQHITSAVPVRERTLVGARWRGAASGRLVVQADAGGLSVENQLGRDLHDLTVWHDDQPYTFQALESGARARAAASGTAVEYGPSWPRGAPLVVAVRPLLQTVVGGGFGKNRYVARFDWTQETSALLDDSAVRSEPGAHWIAGVY